MKPLPSVDLNDAVYATDEEAEAACLGTLLLGDDKIRREVWDIVQPRMFWQPYNQTIAAAIQAHDGKVCDMVVIREHLKAEGELEAVGGVSYIVELAESVPTWVNGKTYAMLVRRDYFRRMVVNEMLSCSKQLLETPGHDKDWNRTLDIRLNKAQKYAEALANEPGSDKTIGELVRGDDSDTRTLASGFGDFDVRFGGGFTFGELAILAGSPGMGKTTLANCVALSASARNVPVCYISLEVSWKNLALSMTSAMSGELADYVRDGSKYKTWENELVRQWFEELTTNREIYYGEDRNIYQIIEKARSLIRNKGVQLVILDHIQLVFVPTKRSMTENDRLTRASGMLKDLAKQEDVVVLVLSQLRRGHERGIKSRPKLEDLRGSGSIEQDADAVYFLHRPVFYCKNDHDRSKWKGFARLECAKRRHGVTGSIWLYPDLACARFCNLDPLRWPKRGADPAPVAEVKAGSNGEATGEVLPKPLSPPAAEPVHESVEEEAPF